MHNFLYIAFNFPPFGGPGPRHNLGTIKGLLGKGFMPTVITASERKPPPVLLGTDEYLRSKIPDKITVIPCDWPFKKRRVLPFILYVLKFVPAPQSFSRGSRYIADIARRQCEGNDYELIYSVDGISLEHQAALKLKQSTGLPWVAEFRDPWIHDPLYWQEMSLRSRRWWYQRKFNEVKKMLRAVVENADLVIVESPLHAALLTRDFKLNSEKVVALGMGYNADYLHDVTDSVIAFTKRPVLGFVGRVYYGYKNIIKSFVEAMKVLESEGYEFTLVAVGDRVSDPQYTGYAGSFSDFASEVNLESFVPISRLNYLQALSIMNDLDYGIILACDECVHQINSKLWEYLAFNLSILAVAPQGGNVDAILDEGACGYLLPYDTRSMVPALKEALNDYKAGRVRRASPDFVAGYSREKMIAQLARRMEELL